MNQLIELKQKRHAYIGTMRNILDGAINEKRGLTQAEECDYDGLKGKVASIDALIARIENVDPSTINTEAHSHTEPLRPGELRALNREEKVSDLFPAENRERLDIGKYVRGLATGNWDGADAERRAMTEGTVTAGGHLVPAPLSSMLIDLSRAHSVTVAAGVKTVPMDSSSLKFARVTNDATVSWLGELAPATLTAPSFDGVTLQAKKAVAIVQASTELLQDAPNGSQVVSHLLSSALAAAIDKAVLIGKSSAGGPVGIAEQSGVNVIDMGTNGATISGYSEIIKALTMLGNANVDLANVAAIYNPTVYGAYEGLVDANGNAKVAPAAANKLRKLMTSALPATETQGSASTASRMIIGDFGSALLGVRRGIEIAVSNSGYDGDSETFLKSGVLIRVSARVDVAVTRANHFVVVKGILPPA
jgi:HK97 family phage major capsid protein